MYNNHKVMEVIDLGLDNLETISINLDDVMPNSNSSNSSKSSSNFGPGIELLMQPFTHA